jgi:anti-sigma regulatory factor (Ser/Thr protein kinase)
VSTSAVRRSWPASASAVPAARRAVREHLSGSDRASLVESAELIVSELVGNVVLHVGGDIELAVDVREHDVVLEVSDSSPLSPHLRMFSRTSSTGRGMRLVHSLSAEHGVRARASADGGKTVWARLTTSSAERGDDEIAASFADVDWLAELSDAELDEGAPAGHLLQRAA